MKFSILAPAFALLASASAVSVAFDRGYDDASRSMSTVTCSDGPNGLMKKYPTQGSLPGFPHIGGVPGVGWNSPSCGSCWKLTYEGTSVNIIAVDSGVGGFNLAFAAMDELTGGNAEFLGRIEAEAVEVDRSVCGM